jgi:LysR family transcriptional activator of glutamate synthase operon
MLITEQQLKVFIKVAELIRSPLAVVAEKLHITPQALSRSILSMEMKLQAPLFVRSSSGFGLTELGTHLLPQAQALYKRKLDFYDAAREICEKSRKKIRIAAETGAIVSTLPIEAVLQSDILFVGNYENCLERLKNGQADIVYSRQYEGLNSELRYIPVVKQDIQVIMREDHELAAKERLSIDDLKGREILHMPRILFPYNLTSLCEQSGFTPILRECPNTLIFVNLLKHSAGIGLIPPIMFEECDTEHLEFRPIDIENKECNIGFYARDNWKSMPQLRQIIESSVANEHNMEVSGEEDAGSWSDKTERERSPLADNLHLTEQQLRLFNCIAMTGSVSKAAELLSITQQAASKRLSAMERELGVALMVRGGARKVTLTEAGEALLPHSQQMISEIDAWYKYVKEQCAKKTETVKVALEARSLIMTFPPYYPENINVNTIMCNGINECFSLLESGKTDIVYCSQRKDLRGYRYIPVYCSMPVVLMNERHPLSSRKELSLAELKDEKFAIFDQSDPFNTNFMKACKQVGFNPKIAAKSYNDSLLIRLVRAGKCLMILPPSALSAISLKSLKTVPLRDRQLLFMTGLVIEPHRELSPAADTFIRSFIKRCQENGVTSEPPAFHAEAGNGAADAAG